jgi:hypothetical protein
LQQGENMTINKYQLDVIDVTNGSNNSFLVEYQGMLPNKTGNVIFVKDIIKELNDIFPERNNGDDLSPYGHGVKGTIDRLLKLLES